MAGKFWNLLEKAGLAEKVEESASEEAPPPPPPTASKAPPVPAAKVSDPADQARIAELDKGARQQLAQAMEADGAPLVEELGDLLDTLKESIEDEKIRYTTALKILTKKGHSVLAICGDFDKCIGVLEQKDREFSGQLKDQFEKRVGSKAEQVTRCTERIATIRKQIATLEEEVSTLAAQAHEAQEGITEEQTKLNQVQERFELAYRAIRTEVESQRAKVAQYGEKL